MSIIKRSLNKIRRTRSEATKRRNLALYLENRIPWSAGYDAYRWEAITKALNNNEFLQGITSQVDLPDGYGYALDERIVEYPWLFAHLPKKLGKVLDAGSVINHKQILDQMVDYDGDLTIMTLAPESQAFWEQGISYQYGDLRETPFQDGWFNTIICLSTLEHVGMDNSIYHADVEAESGTVWQAIAELWRILKAGGELYISVPYGIQHTVMIGGKPFMQQFDETAVEKMKHQLEGGIINETYFRYSASGWQFATADECNDAVYFNIHETDTIDDDYAAAARAVYCLKVKKPL